MFMCVFVRLSHEKCLIGLVLHVRYKNAQLRNYSEQCVSICFRTVKRILHNQSLNFTGTKSYLEGNELEDSSRQPDLSIFYLSCIVSATDNFSMTNKIGQGGFGSVFKVQLQFLMSSLTSSQLFFLFHIPLLCGCEWGK